MWRGVASYRCFSNRQAERNLLASANQLLEQRLCEMQKQVVNYKFVCCFDIAHP